MFQIAIAWLIGLICFTMHAFATVGIDYAVRYHWGRRTRPRFFRDRIVLVVGAAFGLLVLHTAEGLVWAASFSLFQVGSTAGRDVYLAFVSFAALGYGDVVTAGEYHLLGAFAAITGILLFGWSAGVLFQVLRTTIPDVHGYAIWAKHPLDDPAVHAVEEAPVRPGL